MGFVDAIPDWTLKSIFFGQLSFFVHVCTSNQFKSEVVTQDLGRGDFVLDDLAHSFEVTLVSIHDDVLVAAVQHMSKLLSE